MYVLYFYFFSSIFFSPCQPQQQFFFFIIMYNPAKIKIIGQTTDHSMPGMMFKFSKRKIKPTIINSHGIIINLYFIN